MTSSLMPISYSMPCRHFSTKLNIVIWSINLMCITNNSILFKLTRWVLIKSYLMVWLIWILFKSKGDPFILYILQISLTISAAILVKILSRIRRCFLIILSWMVLSVTQWTFIDSLNSSVWMMDCFNWLVSFVVGICKWRLWSLMLDTIILLTNLLSLSLCLPSSLAVLIVFKILLWIFLLKLLVFSQHLLTLTFACLFILHIWTLNSYLVISFHWDFGGGRWLADLNFDSVTFGLISFGLCFDWVRDFDELFGLAFRCDSWGWSILFYSLKRLRCWIQRIIHPISLHDLNAFHFWIVYFDFSYVLKLIWTLCFGSLLLASLLPQDFLHMMHLRLFIIIIKCTSMVRKFITLAIYFSNHLILLVNWWIGNLLLLSTWFYAVVGAGIIPWCLIISQIIRIIAQIQSCMISSVCSFWSSSSTLCIFAVSVLKKWKLNEIKKSTYW